MALVRHYECDECGCKFEKFHFEKPIQVPECPGCQALAHKQTQIPAGFSIGSTKSKAVDLAYDIVSKDMGMTDMKDRLREGDIAAVTPPAMAPAVQNFWNSGSSAAPAATMAGVISAAKVNAQTSDREGRNPMKMLQKSISASGRPNAKVICRPINRVN